jgi:magnesium chelatase family protein
MVRSLARDRGVRCNAELQGESLAQAAPLEAEARALLEQALLKGQLSGRGLRRIQCVARTIRDLDDAGPSLRPCDVMRAIGLRSRAPIGGADA